MSINAKIGNTLLAQISSIAIRGIMFCEPSHKKGVRTLFKSIKFW